MDCRALAKAINTLAYRRFSRRDTCIIQTRLAVLVLRELKIDAYPLSVRTIALNVPAIKLLAEGCYYKGNEEVYAEHGAWSICLGGHVMKMRPGRWPGHLVAVAGRRMMLDCSLDNISRPLHKMILVPDAFPVYERFLRGKDQIRLNDDVQQLVLHYEAIPADKSFLDAPDWVEGDMTDLVKVLVWEVQRSGGLELPPPLNMRDYKYQEEDAKIALEAVREVVL